MFSQPFVEQTGIVLTGVINSSVAWGDYDNDGDLDILLTGWSYGSSISKIYKNNSNNTFTEQTNISLTNVEQGSVAWGDYDNDGDLDFLLTGLQSYVPISKIYKNNGNNTFSEQTDISLTGVYYSSVAWGDYDNDGSLDILLTGATSYPSPLNQISKIYHNNGDNSFTEHTGISFTGVDRGSAGWGDYDNDGDLDILLTGNGISKIYRNDNGNFSEIDAGLTGVGGHSTAWGDYDNDNDLDILLTGYWNSSYISKIYNNNNGVFTDIGAGLTGVSGSSAAWGDYDNDGDLDILLTGYTGSIYISIIYRNDNGVFTDIGAGLTEISGSSAAWCDYDNDGDLDILLTGQIGSVSVSKIYRNDISVHNSLPSVPVNLQTDGLVLSWNASTDAETPSGSITYNIRIGTQPGINDIYTSMSESDGKRQLPQPGNLKNRLSIIPTITKNGTYYWSIQAVDNQLGASAWAPEQTLVVSDYPEVTLSTPDLTAISFDIPVSISFTKDMTDFDLSDIVVTNGIIHKLETITPDKEFRAIVWPKSAAVVNLYIKTNSVTGINGKNNLQSNNLFLTYKPFSDFATGLTGVEYGTIDWGDYDNDGDLDLILTGGYGLGLPSSKIFNNNNGVFTDIGAGLTGVSNSSVAWGDYDNDGDLDILLTGNKLYSSCISIIYQNNNGVFIDINAGLPGVRNGSIAWGDYDNDGDPDILLTGSSATGNISKILRNDNGVFTDINAGLQGISYSSAGWGDYDNDGDLDILLTGNSALTGNSSSGISRIYRNDNGIFTDINAGLADVKNGSSTAWGDYDNDGDLDILLISWPYSGTGSFSKIYQNNNGVFTDINAYLPDIPNISGEWVDYDNDGDLDIILTGSGISKICRNVNGIFTNFDLRFTDVSNSSMACGDYDSDGDVDVLLSGYKIVDISNIHQISKLYQNNITPPNAIPTPPTIREGHLEGNKTVFFWSGATDTETPVTGLTYNIRIGRTPGGGDILSPMTLASGKRKIVTMGNVQTRTSAWINLEQYLPIDTIYWSIQSMDNNFAGSAWTPEQKLVINALRADFGSTTICRDVATQFTDNSVTGNNLVIDKWEWVFGDGQSVTITDPALKNVMYTYSAGGIYNATLTVYSGLVSHSVTKEVNVKYRPDASFTTPTVCIGSNTSFSNNSDLYGKTVTEWYWDFKDGFTSNAQNPGMHGYTNPGTYNVLLRITTSEGCIGEIIKPVFVAEHPNAFATVNGSSTFCEGDSTTLITVNNTNYTYQWFNGPNPVTNGTSYQIKISFSGTYTVEVTNPSASCKSTSNSLVIISSPAPPRLVITSGNYEAGKCLGDTPLRLNVDQGGEGYNYQWLRNGIPLNGENLTYLEGFLSSGDYTVVAEQNGCKSQSEIFNVYFTDAPEKPIIYVGGPNVWYLACSNDSATFYKWYYNGNPVDGADKYIYVANRKIGQYQVIIANKQGCLTASDVVTIPTGATGTNDIDLFEGLKIYPNPTTGLFTVEIDNNIFGELLISVIAEQGKEISNIKSQKVTEHYKTEIDLSSEAKGVYFINLQIDKYSATRKIILE
jgi:hypothetical protein